MAALSGLHGGKSLSTTILVCGLAIALIELWLVIYAVPVSAKIPLILVRFALEVFLCLAAFEKRQSGRN